MHVYFAMDERELQLDALFGGLSPASPSLMPLSSASTATSSASDGKVTCTEIHIHT